MFNEKDFTVHRIQVGALFTNCYLVQGGIIIDPGGDDEKIISAITTFNFKPEIIVLTHSHFDHIVAAGILATKYDIPIYAHNLAVDILNDPDSNLSSFFAEAVSIIVDTALNDGDIIKCNETELQVIHTPGHSTCSISLYTPGYLFSGDTLFDGGYGRYDLPGSNFEDLKSSLEKLLDLPGSTKFYPGHGNPGTIQTARRQLSGFIR